MHNQKEHKMQTGNIKLSDAVASGLIPIKLQAARNAAKSGRLKAFKLKGGRDWYVTRESLAEFIRG